MSNQFKRLGELLVSHGLITNLQLSIGLAAQTTSNRRIGDILVERGFVTEEQIAKALAEQYGYPLADLSKARPQPAALIAVGPDNALSLGVLPLRLSEDSFECIIADPVDVVSTDQLSHLLRRRVILQIAPKTALLNTIRATFGLDEPISQEIFAELSFLPPRFTEAEAKRRFGKVAFFDARDTTLDRPVTLASVPVDSPEEKSQFWLVQSAARANSNSVCAVYDWFEHKGFRWSVFERLSGETLEHVLETRGQRSIPAAAEMIADIAQGVDSSNQTGGWCGLVCPSNVLVRRSGAILVPFATPPEYYSCPEIEEGRQGTPVSDVFALGTLLWECVTGKNPHEQGWATPGKDDETVPPALADVIKKCVDQDPEKRYASAIQLANVMRSYNWFAVNAATGAKTEAHDDRDELLSKITSPQAAPLKVGFWQRLFGRKAA